MTKREANLKHCCLICGAPDANLLRLPDGRNVRACDECLRAGDNTWTSYEEREPLPCEIPCLCGASSHDTWSGPGVHHQAGRCARVFTALLLALLLPLVAHAAPQKAPRHTVKPVSTITVKTVPDAAYERKAAELHAKVGARFVITSQDLDSCVAWISDRSSAGVELEAFKGCRKAIDLAVDSAHAAAERRLVP